MKKSFLDYVLRVRLPITVFVVIVAFAITYYASRPERDGIGYAPTQPINFSHELHAGDLEISCQYCHTGVEKTRQAVVPAASTCMSCHSIAKADKPEIKKLKKYYDEGIAIPWKRVNRVPDFVYFDHSVHVTTGLTCSTCHGDVKNMDKITQVESFTMSTCLSCHRNVKEKVPYVKNLKNAPENCWTCHR